MPFNSLIPPCLMLCPLPLMAQPDIVNNDQPSSSYYLGIGAGLSHFYDDSLSSDIQLSEPTLNEPSMRLYAGFRLHPALYLELGYSRYGEVAYDRGPENFLTSNFTAYSLAANIGGHIHPSWRVFGLLGGALLQLETEYLQTRTKSDYPSLHYGAGVEFIPVSRPRTSLRLSYEGDYFANNKATIRSYDFAISALFLSGQYNF